MSEVALKVTKRETGKKATKAVRNGGGIPGVYYSKNDDAVSIISDELALRPIVYTSETKVINLEIEGEDAKKAVLKDIAFDPITDKITHFDLLGLHEGHKVTVTVPLKYVGQSKGVLAGGVFRPVMSSLQITCLPQDLPDRIDVDISGLDVGTKLYLNDIRPMHEKFDFVIKQNTALCAVGRPRVKATPGA
jgi:large subunit ribosomal protein L25